MSGKIPSALVLLAALVLVLGSVPSATAAPAGPPVRVGSTLALTGPLGPTSIVHKLAGEISVEQP